MVNINNKDIRITRGDSCIINLTIYDSAGDEYTPAPGDTIIFTVKSDINNDYKVIEKEFNNSEITLLKSDTISLNFGTYFYDVRLENGSIFDTVLDSGNFIIEGGTANARN